MATVTVRFGFTMRSGRRLWSFSERHFLTTARSLGLTAQQKALDLASVRCQLLGPGVTHVFSVLSDLDILRDALILPVDPPQLLGATPYYNPAFIVGGLPLGELSADFPWSNILVRKQASNGFHSEMYLAGCPDFVQEVRRNDPFANDAFVVAWRNWSEELTSGWGMQNLEHGDPALNIPIISAGTDGGGALFRTALPHGIGVSTSVLLLKGRVRLASTGQEISSKGFLPQGYLKASFITPTLFRVRNWIPFAPFFYLGRMRVRVQRYQPTANAQIISRGFATRARSAPFFPATWEADDPAVRRILSPCGQIMDYLPFCYQTRIRPFRDSNLEVGITWRRAAPNALPFPYHHRFASAFWNSDPVDLLPWNGPGEVKGAPRESIPVRVSRAGSGHCFRGERDWWENGAPISALTNPPPLDPSCVCDGEPRRAQVNVRVRDSIRLRWRSRFEARASMLERWSTSSGVIEDELLLRVSLSDSLVPAPVWNDTIKAQVKIKPNLPLEPDFTDHARAQIQILSEIELAPHAYIYDSFLVNVFIVGQAVSGLTLEIRDDFTDTPAATELWFDSASGFVWDGLKLTFTLPPGYISSLQIGDGAHDINQPGPILDIEFDLTAGFLVDVGANHVTLIPATETQAGGMGTETQRFAGEKTFVANELGVDQPGPPYLGGGGLQSRMALSPNYNGYSGGGGMFSDWSSGLLKWTRFALPAGGPSGGGNEGFLIDSDTHLANYQAIRIDPLTGLPQAFGGLDDVVGIGARCVAGLITDGGADAAVPGKIDVVNKDVVGILQGQALAPHSSGTGVVLAVATAGNPGAIGLARSPAAVGFSTTAQTEGLFQLADWTAITGSAALSPLALYYVDPAAPGMLTATCPTAGGEVIQVAGVAVAPDTLDLRFEPPLLL